MSYPWQGESFDYYLPMINFDTVEKGLYRSGYPIERNRPFLQKLGIKTILYIEPNQMKESSQRDLEEYCKGHRMNYIYCPFDPNMFASKPVEVSKSLSKALSVVLDKRNHPLLINCLKGQFYTGIFVSCIRRLQEWSYHSIYAEYSLFVKKMHIYDMLVVELFDAKLSVREDHLPEWFTKEMYDNFMFNKDK